MKIAILGRGDVGAGLADLWRSSGHVVDTLGRDGGDVGGADVVVVAVPHHTVTEALGNVTGLNGQVAVDVTNVTGLNGQVAVDVTNVTGPRVKDFDSVALEVKSIIGGPTAKAFCTIFASTYRAVGSQRVKPTVLSAADEDAQAIVRRLIADAGFDGWSIGQLAPGARLLEDSYSLWMAAFQAGGAYLPRYAAPGELDAQPPSSAICLSRLRVSPANRDTWPTATRSAI